MNKIKYTVPSSDKLHTLAGVVYLPDIKPIGFFHIVHGMTEHIARYDKIMTDLAAAGYICFGFDNLGHGYTVKDKTELGYIAEKQGYDLLAQDVKLFSDAVMAEHGNKEKLPYCLLGHSMGSFITRLAVTKYVKPDKYIIMGTGGSNPVAGMGLVVIAIIKKLYGDRHISPLIYKLAMGDYNKRFGGGTPEDPNPWITNDEEQRKKYYTDDYCTFKFTVSAMGDLVMLNKITSEAGWYKAVPKNIPVLLVSGENDPVGNYGKGVKEVCERLNKEGINAKFIIYPDARHEILNDFTYDDVKKDIFEFLNSEK